MKDQTTDGVSRRDLLRGSLGAVLAAGCFTSIGLREALREAHAAGNPFLIEPEINRMIPPPQNRQAYLGAIDFAKRDLPGSPAVDSAGTRNGVGVSYPRFH